MQLCRYGSDPLKTYLPNSDIDITLIPIIIHQKLSSKTDKSSQADGSNASALSAANSAKEEHLASVKPLSSLNFYHELDR